MINYNKIFNFLENHIFFFHLGLVNRCICPVVMALTTCILEMRDIMVKLLPEVLLNMSKLSATTQIAVPVLEFLSSEYN